ncbi:MAG: calcium/sodium antiporter [Candidatus Margulisiibacteriota bacterium]
MTHILLETILFAIGVTLLIKGADWLIQGSVLTARVLRISNLLIGLTVVAFGTSAPEMFVSIMAAIQQKPDISIGNIMGSCTANIALVLGCAALLKPVTASKTITFIKMPMLLGSALLITLVSWDLSLSRFDGILLLLAFAGFMWFSIFHEKQTQPVNDKPKSAPIIKDILLIIIGLAGIIIGAQILINSATVLARTFGVSELVIGISMVAIGTSLPEMATSLVAVWKNEEDIGIANIVGSNIFNILLILGVVGLFSPILINPRIMTTDIWIMNGFTILLFLFCLHRGFLNRTKGLILLAGYIAYIWYLFIR